MRDRSTSLKVITMMLFASSLMISCGPEVSPLDSMKEPIELVRNDSVIEVRDSNGNLYVLNTEERTAYRTAFLKPGDILAINSTE